LTYAKGTNPTHGIVVVNSDGTYTYTPAVNYNGNDSFTVTVSDGNGGTTTTTVFIVVTPVNDAPEVNDPTNPTFDAATGNYNLFTGQNAAIDGAIKATDLDADILTFNKTGNPSNGTVLINADGTYTYTPNNNFIGNDSFIVTVNDGKGGSDIVTVHVNTLALPKFTKKASVPVSNVDGTYGLKYTIIVNNDTDQRMESIQVVDDLDKVFKDKNCDYTVTGITASGTLLANGLYKGYNNTETLIKESSYLNPNSKDSITIEVTVNSHQFVGVVYNQAVLGGYIPTGKYIFSNVVSDDPTLSGIKDMTPSTIPEVALVIPDGFSPNDDAFNQTFIIKHSESTRVSMEVYNRWGNNVYQNADYRNEWNGKGTGNFLGKDLPTGTYYCACKLIEISTGKIISNGVKYITLRR